MHENETIISGVVPPKKKSRMARIAGAVFLVAIVAGLGWGIILGKAQSFTAATWVIAKQSWDQMLGVAGDGPIVAEVDLNSDDSIVNNISSTMDVGQNSSSDAVQPDFGARAGKKPSKKKKSSGISSGDVQDSGAEDAPGGADDLSTAGSLQASSASLDDVAITDPLTIFNDDADVSSSSDALNSGSATSLSSKHPVCSFSGATTTDSISPRIILNEVAWMGTPSTTGETVTQAANHEWIELKNITASPIDLAGWQVADAAGNIDALFGAGDEIGPGGFVMLSRDGDAVQGVTMSTAYLGGLSNAGEVLGVFDAGCGISDILDASQGWPGGDNLTKQTLERKVGGVGWQTSLLPGGTPGAENSIGAVVIASTTPISSTTYPVEITIDGDGAGKVTSKPTGISCSTSGASVCTATYASGTLLTLTATPGTNAIFSGWTGPCSGDGSCSFSVDGSISVVAQFHAIPSTLYNSTISESQTADSIDATGASSSSLFVTVSSTVPDTSSSESQFSAVTALTHVLITQIQTGGASSSNDFVTFYNPTTAAIDLSSWKLHKKSSTGTDYSLRDFPNGTAIAAGSYFTWANSIDGFAELINADASSTETLSADNSVALMDSTGAIIDAVAWGAGSNQYGEGPPFPTDPVSSQILLRKSSGGTFIDTSNNAEDFFLP